MNRYRFNVLNVSRIMKKYTKSGLPIVGVLFTIGMFCYFYGCDPDYPDQCYAYDVVQGVSYGYRITKKQCSECVVRSKSGCVKYDYFDCWNTDIRYRYGNNNTCYFNIVSETTNENFANQSGKNYPIGKNRDLIKSETSQTCYDAGFAAITWMVGIIFLALTGLMVAVFIFLVSCCENDEINGKARYIFTVV